MEDYNANAANTDGVALSQTSARLTSIGFVALLLTQFLGACNDNIFRWFVVGVGKQYFTSDPATVLMAGTACFVGPYLVLAAMAGFLADRLSKRTVIVACKVAELMIMLLGMAAIMTGQLWAIFVVLIMMGAQSALFSPSKTGSIPEQLDESRISAANGWFGLATVVATVVGTGIGNLLSDYTRPKGQANWLLSASVLIGFALVGLAVSLFITRVPAANPARKFPWNAAGQTLLDLRSLWTRRALWRVALGITFFWSLGTLANLNIDQFAFARGASRQTEVTPLLACLVAGIGGGSVLAGILSRGKIELGLLPVGAFGIAASLIGLFIIQGPLIVDFDVTVAYIFSCFFLLVMGMSAGLFNVPLEAYIQHRSPRESRGAVLAAANFITFVGILVASLLFWVLRTPLDSGSLSDVATMRQLNVSPAERRKIESLSEQFRHAFETTNKLPAPDDCLNQVTGNARLLLAGTLAWTEMELGQRTPWRRAYVMRRYPEYEQLVSSVTAEAMGRSLCRPRDVFLICGLLAIAVLMYIFWRIPHESLRFFVWIITSTVYRLRVQGQENLPQQGPGLIVSNHVSWLDGQLLMYINNRPLRMFVWEGNFANPFMRWLANEFGAIYVSSGPKSIRRALETARQALRDGELVGIFPEGGITRTGQTNTFRPGMLKILEETDAPVIPVYIDEMWGSIFSFERGRFLRKWPLRLPYPISIHVGKAVDKVQSVHQARQAVLEVGANAVKKRQHGFMSLSRSAVRNCKKRKFRSKIADSSGADLSGAQCLLRTLVLRRLLLRHVLAPDEKNVGVFLPPSAGAVLTNFALTLDKRVAINLNYTVSSEVLNDCIAAAGIKHVLTSRRFMSKMEFDLDTELVYLEDFKDKPTLADKVSSALSAYVAPASWLERRLGLGEIDGDDLLTVIFTSGSTGTPKGVMLTFDNIASNAEAIDQVIHLNSKDVIVGILPFFHSFGYTVTLWTALALDVKSIYHYSPIDGKRIGKLVEEHKASILLATPTFLRNYLRRCTPEQFKSLEVVVAGAEKLPIPLCDAFEEKFGVRPAEGYGCTELSPLVSVNVPPSRNLNTDQKGLKEGTVGRPVPGVAARIVNLETGAVCDVNEEGMLQITGPNVMKGYLSKPEKTAEVIKDGWYVTGDIALIDNDGFIQITGRESRFSKIGGEMVPHIRIEDALNELIGADEETGLKAAVTAVPDERKGERLIVLHTDLDKTPEELRDGLTQMGLPNLFIPAADAFVKVDEIPILGTGKLDLKRMKDKALELVENA